MKSLLSATLAALLGIALSACGQSHRSVVRLSYMNTPQAKLGGATPMGAAVIRHKYVEKFEWAHLTPQPHLANDGDHEETGDEDHDNSSDTGATENAIDPYQDYLPPTNNRVYHDEDDQYLIESGTIPLTAEMPAFDALVEHYYAAVAAGDGARACSLMTRQLAQAAPIDYGRLGPPYLRGGKTCADVVSRLSRHVHAELTEPIAVTQVRINYNRVDAEAFVGSRKVPASEISLGLEHGSWRISQIFATPLP